MATNISGAAIGAGAAMMALGVGFYALIAQSDASPSATALIPVAIGLPIAACGFIARNALRRKAAMHAAAGLGLLGLLGSLMSARKWPLLLTGQDVARPLAAWEQLLMFLICATFVGLCVKSFRDARRVA